MQQMQARRRAARARDARAVARRGHAPAGGGHARAGRSEPAARPRACSAALGARGRGPDRRAATSTCRTCCRCTTRSRTCRAGCGPCRRGRRCRRGCAGEINNSVNLIRYEHAAPGPRRAVVERWDFAETSGAFAPVTQHELVFDASTSGLRNLMKPLSPDAIAHFAGEHALAGFGVLLLALVVGVPLAWRLVLRYGVPREQGGGASPKTLLVIYLALSFAIIAGAAALFAAIADELGAEEELGRLDQTFADAIGAVGRARRAPRVRLDHASRRSVAAGGVVHRRGSGSYSSREGGCSRSASCSRSPATACSTRRSSNLRARAPGSRSGDRNRLRLEFSERAHIGVARHLRDDCVRARADDARALASARRDRGDDRRVHAPPAAACSCACISPATCWRVLRRARRGWSRAF